jgi:superfamily I DNA/RNA helicase
VNDGIAAVEVSTDPEGEALQPGVRLATMHRLKGLEFPRVILVGVQDGVLPLPVPESGNPVSEDEHQLKERCLLYVAMTRARDVLVVTGYGGVSPLLC